MRRRLILSRAARSDAVVGNDRGPALLPPSSGRCRSVRFCRGMSELEAVIGLALIAAVVIGLNLFWPKRAEAAPRDAIARFDGIVATLRRDLDAARVDIGKQRTEIDATKAKLADADKRLSQLKKSFDTLVCLSPLQVLGIEDVLLTMQQN
jgi:hypothetical protein